MSKVLRSAWVIAVFMWSPTVSAQTSAYCATVRERAADDAALLTGPRLIVEGLRFPQNGQLEGGTIIGSGFQARAALAFSPTDLRKGLGVLRAGEADCRQHEARLELETAIGAGDDDARRAALRAQVVFLEAHEEQMRGWVARTAARFSARVITLVELEDVRTRAAALALKLVRARGQVHELDAKRPPAEQPTHLAAGELDATYDAAAAAFEHAQTRVRSGDAWHLELTAGVIPYPTADWYGIVHLAFNLGGLMRPGHVARYERDKADERAHAPYEATARLTQSHDTLVAKLEQGRLELALLDKQLEELTNVSQLLAGSESPTVLDERDKLSLEHLALESERVFERTYVEELGATLNRK
jgi:hypothetical protein